MNRALDCLLFNFFLSENYILGVTFGVTVLVGKIYFVAFVVSQRYFDFEHSASKFGALLVLREGDRVFLLVIRDIRT